MSAGVQGTSCGLLPSSTSTPLGLLHRPTRLAFAHRRRAPPSITKQLQLRASSQQQQPQPEQQGAAPPQLPPPGGDGNGGGSSSLSSEFVPAAIADYDKYMEQARMSVEDGKMRLKEIDDNIDEMKRDAAPAWALGVMQWTRGMAQDAVDASAAKHVALMERREGFIAGLRQLAVDLEASPPIIPPDDTTSDWLATAGYTWAQQEGEDGSPERLQTMLKQALEQTSSPSSVMWASVLACLIIAWVISWSGTLAGVDAYRLLHDAPDWQAAPMTWLTWTAPYVGGTLGAFYVNPALITKSIIRGVASNQQQLYRRIDGLSLASAAILVAYCQCLVYQGLWQDVFTSWLGGSRDPTLLTDPFVLEDSVKQSMGTLVASPRLPAFLLAPSSAVLTGLLEGGYFWAALTLRESANTLNVNSTEDDMEVSVVLLEPSVLSSTELPLVCTRVALSGMYLGLEATLTGSLWYAVGTSAAGLLTAMLLSKQDSGSSGGGSGR